MTTVLKLGGSVVTDKSRPETVDTATLERAATDIATHSDPEPNLVVIHGGGSFGHPHAERHGVSTTEGTHDPAAVREIHAAMRVLNTAVVDALADAGVPAVPVAPFAGCHRADDPDTTLTVPADTVATMLGEGFVPVLHGDVVAHAGSGATILSGDELVTALATELDADRVGLCSDVPGVLDTDGTVIPRIDAFDDAADALGGSDATDVTGGMAAKVRALVDLEAPATVFDPDALAAFLDGEDAGTLIAG
jgi:isopentenyl phosphate kinase